LGKEVIGEGYIGLAHAFLQAGARCLLVSLWEVDDTATSLLMTRFYQSLVTSAQSGQRSGGDVRVGKAEALQEAKAWLREYTDDRGQRPYAHPYYWSAFILFGDTS
jgi:CHAT domain-containing protein